MTMYWKNELEEDVEYLATVNGEEWAVILRDDGNVYDAECDEIVATYEQWLQDPTIENVHER